jgi:hypothetical protein
MDIGGCRRSQPGGKVRVGAVDGASQLGAETLEAGLGQGVEQSLAIGEVPARGCVTDSDLARQPTQRQVLSAALSHGALGSLQQSRSEVAVVIGALVHDASLAD